MINFAVIGLPRSGTTWAANWLSADGVVCHHDPLAHTRAEDLHALDGGIACTGIWLRPDALAGLTCPIVRLWRDPDAVNRSLRAIGLNALPDASIAMFEATPGLTFHYECLFEARANAIWRTLRGTDMDRARHAELARMNIQPQYARCRPDASILMDFMQGAPAHG